MKSPKSLWKLFLGGLLGFLVGAGMFHTSTAKAAQSRVLSITPITNPDTPQNVGATAVTVVGFSCIPDSSHPGHGVCYVLSH